MTQADLAGLARAWTSAPEVESGVAEMLTVARALFVQSWWRYEFQTVAVLWSLMAVEAALRTRFPSQSTRTTLAQLLERARDSGALNDEEFVVLGAGRKLRNSLVHAVEQTTLGPGGTAPMLATAHLLINRLCSERAVGEAPSDGSPTA
jgi:hypothetical protein